MVVFKKPTTTRTSQKDGVGTRACEGDVNARIEMLGKEFDNLKPQILDLDEEKQNELKRQFSDVTDTIDLGELLCNPDTESEEFIEKLEELQMEEKNDLCEIFEKAQWAPWNWD